MTLRNLTPKSSEILAIRASNTLSTKVQGGIGAGWSPIGYEGLVNSCKRQVHSRLLWSCHNFVGYSHIFEWASKKHNCLTAPFFTLTPKVGLKHLGATHCLLMLPHTSHLLGQASEAHECKGNPPASCAAGARHQSIHFGMRATAWLIHVLKNTPFTSISWILVDGAARVPTQWIIKIHGN